MQTPKKRFGQHFLTDTAVIAQIMRTIDPQAEEVFVEIGPGRGALTKPLLDTLTHLHVVEVDKDICVWLRQKFSSAKLTVHETDVLRFNFSQNFHRMRIVGNLPYNISTEILFYLLKFLPLIQDMYFMLQKEVVDRIVAEPNSKTYGRLSVFLQYHLSTERCFDVLPTAFYPPPKVTSTIVHCIPRQERFCRAENESVFAMIVTTAFSQRRKTLKNSLSSLFDTAQISALGIDPQVRAENLSIVDFVKLANAYQATD